MRFWKPSEAAKAVARLAKSERPWWVRKGEVIDFECFVDSDHDGWTLHGWWMRGLGRDAEYREASANIPGEAFAAARADENAVVRIIRQAIAEVLTALRPSTPTPEAIDLAMQAVQDVGALEVLVDNLLEDGTLTPPEETLWTTRDGARAFLASQAKVWATRHIEDRWRMESGELRRSCTAPPSAK